MVRTIRWCLVLFSLLGLVALTVGSASAQSRGSQELLEKESSSGSEVLRWGLNKGQAFKMTFKQDINQKMEVPGRGPQEIPIKQEVEMTWDVIDSDEESFTLELVLTRMQMSIKSGFINMEYDSDDPDSNPQLNDSISKMLGKKVIQKMGRNGKVLEVKLPPEMEGDSGGGVPSGDMIKQMNQQSALVFPEGQMTVGKSWNSGMDIEMNGMKMKNKVTYTYAGKEKVDGKELHKFNLSTDVAIERGPQGMDVEVKDQKNEGVLYFDNQSGCLVSTKQKQKMSLELNAQGQMIAQEIDGDSLMTIKPVDK